MYHTKVIMGSSVETIKTAFTDHSGQSRHAFINRYPLINKVFKFAINSGLATLLHWSVLYLLIFLNWGAVPANVIGAFIGAVFNYFLHFHLTFHCHIKHTQTVASYILCCMFGWLANSSLFAAFIYFLNASILVSQLVVAAMLGAINFVAYQYWVFHER